MKRKKILLLVLAVLVVLFTVMPVGTNRFKVEASEAYQGMNSESGTVTAADVNLRTGPATTYDIICKLKKNLKVTIIGKMGDWYAVYISSSGNVGAISSQYVKVEKTNVADAGKATADVNKKAASAKTVKATAPTAAIVTKVKDISQEEQALLDFVNKERKGKGLKALEFDAELVKIARLKANDMKDNNYFSHTSKLYGSPFDMMKKYGIKFSAAGENIAGNQNFEKAVKAWLKDNENNLFNEKFTHTGIGVVDSPAYGKIFVQMFIKKA
ncbi:putative YkwD family protein [Ruminiclostridium sufflavum DSM 19573]|uniref:Putative YkwD family protein n=1 Tax=Ruminiclostridium sufflavum DSM 19573 TaxID=1121337 RepID=A0A318XMJ2_9FIRM|nr:CAP domain-containing protein [Ruminiclostridium sufflavum]PYG87976.1 putative YkwD family protein [Ruminiclostridium sufflavum DSM 19573]